METVLRAILIFSGAFLALLGAWKAHWEIKAWETLVKVGQTPPEVGGTYRVYIRLYIFISAVGLTLFVLGLG